MPEQIKADAANAAAGKCPECFVVLGKTAAEVRAHRDACLHSGHLDALKDTDHARRYRVLSALADRYEEGK